MTYVAIVVFLLASPAAFALGVRSRRRPGWLVEIERSEIIVTTDSGDSFRGLLAASERDGLLLDAATLVGAGEQLAGRVWMPRQNIRWVQKP